MFSSFLFSACVASCFHIAYRHICWLNYASVPLPHSRCALYTIVPASLLPFSARILYICIFPPKVTSFVFRRIKRSAFHLQLPRVVDCFSQSLDFFVLSLNPSCGFINLKKHSSSFYHLSAWCSYFWFVLSFSFVFAYACLRLVPRHLSTASLHCLKHLQVLLSAQKLSRLCKWFVAM